MTITGQLIIRKTRTVIDGREVIMVFGVIAAGKGETLEIKGEHQYDVVGMDVMGDLRLHVIQASETDQTEVIRNRLPDQLLTAPIWRI